MAGPFYVDPAAAGANNGSSWLNAWTSIQSAFDTAVAGEIVYCRGTQTIGATLDVDTNSGGNATGYIKFIGCNAAGNQDGTRFKIDANGGAYNGLSGTAAASMVWLENIEIYGTAAGAYYGFYQTGGGGWVLVNCCARNCGGNGFYTGGRYLRCVAYSNGTYGYRNGEFYFCSAHDNTGTGFYSSSAATTIGCLSYDNGDDGFGGELIGSRMLNCVAEGNTDDGISIAAGTLASSVLLIGLRITNHSGAGDIGLNCNSEPVLTLGCYFEDNDGANTQNDSLHYNISIDGTTASSNVEDQANINEGYTSLADGSEDFNLRSDASLRRTAITIPLT